VDVGTTKDGESKIVDCWLLQEENLSWVMLHACPCRAITLSSFVKGLFSFLFFNAVPRAYYRREIGR